jgi:prevent-host-death family protein
MVVSSSDFKANLGQYISHVAESEPLYITKNGRVVAKLSSPAADGQSVLDGLVGITAANPVSLEEARKDRLARQ